MAGIWNFYHLSAKAAEAIHDTTGIPYDYLSPVISPMTFASMSGMALSIMCDSVMHLIEKFFGRHTTINILRTCMRIWLLSSTILICGLGGTPNMYQAYLDNENLFLLILAGAASFFLESRGFYLLTESGRIARASLEQRRAHSADEALANLRDEGFDNNRLTAVNESDDESIPRYCNCFSLFFNCSTSNRRNTQDSSRSSLLLNEDSLSL